MASKKEVETLQAELDEARSELKFLRDKIINELCHKMSEQDLTHILLVLSNRVETREELMKIVRFVSGARDAA